MQAREPLSHRIQLFFTEHFFDARKKFVFFQAHMIVKELAQTADLVRFNRSLRRESFLEITHCGANLSMIRKYAYDFGVPVEPDVPRIRGQQHFLLFAKMHAPRFMPEADKLLRLTLDRRRAFLRRRFGGAPHLQCLNQRKVVVLAKRVQTSMAFHRSIFSSVKPME